MGIVKAPGVENLLHTGKMEVLKLAVELLRSTDFSGNTPDTIRLQIKAVVEQLAESYNVL